MAVQTLRLFNDDVGPKTVKSRVSDTYHLQAWIYPKSTNTGAGTYALVLNCTDSRGVNGPTTVTAVSATQASVPKGAWYQLDGYATVPAGYDTVDPAITFTGVPIADTIYVDDALVREETRAQSIVSQIFGGSSLLSTILPGVVPALDASKITSGALTGATVPGSQLTGTVLSSLLSGAIALGLIPALPTSKITSGTFTSAFLPIIGQQLLTQSNLVLDPGFETTTYWANASNNPYGSQSTDFALSGTHSWKIPAGPSTVVYLTNTDSAVRRVSTRPGEVFQIQVFYYQPVANVANTGTLRLAVAIADSTGVNGNVNQIPLTVNVSSLAKGTWTALTTYYTVPAGYDSVLPFVWYVAAPTGDLLYIDNALVRETTLAQSIIGSIFGGTAVASTIQPAAVPGVDASKIISGTFGQNFVSGLQSLWNSWFGTTTPTGASVLNAANVAALDASKIASGLFGSSLIPNISAGSGAGQSADLQTTLDNLVSQFLQNGGATSGNTPANAATAMSAIQNTVTALGSKIQDQLTGSTGSSQSGKAYQVSFNAWPAGSFSQAPFVVTKTGTGTGGLVLSNGDATWSGGGGSGDVQVVGIYTPSYALTFTGTPSAGNYTITYVNPDTGVSATTATIAWNATAAQIQTALQALTNMPATGVTVVSNPAGGFTITLVATGPLSIGTSSLTGGTAVMTNTGFTNTDYQLLQAQLAGLPNGGGSKNYAILHSNAAGTTYVYGFVYLTTNWTLNWELGCFIAGVQHVWASGTGAPLNLAFTFAAGVGGNPNRYQGISGNTIVFDHTNVSGDPGGLFPIGATQRYWGFRSDTASSGYTTPAPAAFVGCSDNQPPAVPGSSFRQYGTTAATAANHTAGFNVFPSATWFNTNAIITNDISFNATTGAATVSISGTYSFKMRQSVASMSLSSGSISIYPALNVNRGGINTQYICEGAATFINAGGGQFGPTCFAGTMDIQLLAGDIVTPQYYIEVGNLGALNSFNVVGDANGRLTWWSLTLLNCSYN